jgi:hypothetical protein
MKKLLYLRSKTEDRSGIMWLKAGFWKLSRIKRRFKRGGCALCFGDEDAKHTL